MSRDSRTICISKLRPFADPHWGLMSVQNPSRLRQQCFGHFRFCFRSTGLCLSAARCRHGQIMPCQVKQMHVDDSLGKVHVDPKQPGLASRHKWPSSLRNSSNFFCPVCLWSQTCGDVGACNRPRITPSTCHWNRPSHSEPPIWPPVVSSSVHSSIPDTRRRRAAMTVSPWWPSSNRFRLAASNGRRGTSGRIEYHR